MPRKHSILGFQQRPTANGSPRDLPELRYTPPLWRDDLREYATETIKFCEPWIGTLFTAVITRLMATGMFPGNR